MINYENEVDKELKEIIKNKFKVSEPIFYIFLRYMIINKINKIDKINVKYFGLFLLKECNIPNEVIFEGEPIKFFNSEDASILNIISNWILDLHKDTDGVSKIKYLESIYLDINKKTIKECLRYKRTSYYQEICSYNSLKFLNEKFGVETDLIYMSKKFSYPKEFSIGKNTEMILSDKLNILMRQDKNIIFSEKNVENYLKNHLDKLEEGLTFIESQFSIKDAIIDILAKDKNDNTVIIELKIDCDERLVWQSIYYPKQYKLEHPNEKVRMICLSPTFADWILSALEEVRDIELFEYNLIFNNDEILDIKIEKFTKEIEC